MEGGVRTDEINEIEAITNELDICEEIKTVCKCLNKIDTYGDNISNYLSILDKKLDFWDHIVEFDKLNISHIYRVFKERRRLRRIRRKVKNNQELLFTFNKHRQKLLHPTSVDGISIEIFKSKSYIDKRQYSYAEYTDEELAMILGASFTKDK